MKQKLIEITEKGKSNSLNKSTEDLRGLSWWLRGKESTCNAGDMGSIPGWGRSLGGRHGNPLQYSCLENPMDGGAWWATVHVVAKSRTRLSDFTFTFTFTLINSLLCHFDLCQL